MDLFSHLFLSFSSFLHLLLISKPIYSLLSSTMANDLGKLTLARWIWSDFWGLCIWHLLDEFCCKEDQWRICSSSRWSLRWCKLRWFTRMWLGSDVRMINIEINGEVRYKYIIELNNEFVVKKKKKKILYSFKNMALIYLFSVNLTNSSKFPIPENINKLLLLLINNKQKIGKQENIIIFLSKCSILDIDVWLCDWLSNRFGYGNEFLIFMCFFFSS